MDKRRERFAKLLRERFGGRQADMARALDRSPALVWQYLRGHRQIGERFARDVEQILGLPKYWLDGEPAASLPGEGGTEAGGRRRRTRREILRELVDTRFGGKQAQLARAIQRAPAQVSHWLTGHREIGDAGARHIEMSLGLPQGYLDDREATERVSAQEMDLDCLAEAMRILEIMESELGRAKNDRQRAECLRDLYRIGLGAKVTRQRGE